MKLPTVGPEVPRQGNRFSQGLGYLLLHLCRWGVEGEICQLPKFVIVMAPHTSWWDFTNNLGVLLAMRLRVSWFIAHGYTRGMIGRVLSAIGAVPVDRGARSQLVSQMAQHFKLHPQFVLAIFPEGTRKKVSNWKSGFWHIAKQAEVPVQLVSVDYAKRKTIFGPVIHLGDDPEKDVQKMQNHFKSVRAKRPEKTL